MRNQATITPPTPRNTTASRPIAPLAVRIHKPQSRHAGEPVVILSPSNREGYYLAASLSQGTGQEVREVHRSCLLRTAESIKIARMINRKAKGKRAEMSVLSFITPVAYDSSDSSRQLGLLEDWAVTASLEEARDRAANMRHPGVTVRVYRRTATANYVTMVIYVVISRRVDK